ncbi:unnamed protein product [Gordionus sp. m RMFG-2023]
MDMEDKQSKPLNLGNHTIVIRRRRCKKKIILKSDTILQDELIPIKNNDVFSKLNKDLFRMVPIAQRLVLNFNDTKTSPKDSSIWKILDEPIIDTEVTTFSHLNSLKKFPGILFLIDPLDCQENDDELKTKVVEKDEYGNQFNESNLAKIPKPIATIFSYSSVTPFIVPYKYVAYTTHISNPSIPVTMNIFSTLKNYLPNLGAKNITKKWSAMLSSPYKNAYQYISKFNEVSTNHSPTLRSSNSINVDDTFGKPANYELSKIDHAINDLNALRKVLLATNILTF